MHSWFKFFSFAYFSSYKYKEPPIFQLSLWRFVGGQKGVILDNEMKSWNQMLCQKSSFEELQVGQVFSRKTLAQNDQSETLNSF